MGIQYRNGKRVNERMKATLILANGSIFSGASIGSTETRVCEMVFNTSMAGYQEILTDPSYAGQGVVMSYPLIGNYGVNHEDNESRQPWAEAFVVRHLSPRGSNFRCEGDLGSYLKEHNITGIQGVDTRALTKILRSQGSMNGMLTCAEHFNIAQVLEQLKSYRVENTVARVTRLEPQVYPAYGQEKYHVAMMDYGVKQHMIECLRRRGCKVTALPASTPAEAVLSGGYDGVMLSNGPGDPAENTAIITELKKLYNSNIPLFGVCLGHQLLALATGAKTGKLAYGHRGGNHPVRDMEKGRVFITSQNHGYMVLSDSVDPAVAEVSHVNVNDGTCEGLRYKRPKCFTTQFHPEANAGPKDTEYLFNRFIDSMGGDK
jgi:carbamoyl-phosphate synthase small subunit